jgi:hypothetical protein
MWGWLEPLLVGIAKVFKVIFGTSKPVEKKIIDVKGEKLNDKTRDELKELDDALRNRKPPDK